MSLVWVGVVNRLRKRSYVFVGGDFGRNQVGVIAAQTENGPHAEETNYSLDYGGGRGLDRLDKRLGLRAEHEIGNVTSENVEAERRERDEKHVEEPVVAFAHTVGNPWTMMIKALWILTNFLKFF